MKKGDDRRRRILEVAEELFYEKGFEATSLQDILDVLSLSKGGFYHHFESKFALLEAICEQRAETSREAMERAVRTCPGNAVAKLNAMFQKGGLLQDERIEYVGTMLRVAYRGDGASLRERLKRATVESALPVLNAVIREGIAQKLFYTRHCDEIGELLLLLFANLTDELSQILALSERAADAYQRLVEKLEVYRYATERLLDAPYGSIELMSVQRLESLRVALLEQEKRMNRPPEGDRT